MSDSIHYTLDANGNDIEKVETAFRSSGEVLMTEKVDFTYDAASGLLLTETVSRDVDGQWVAKEAYNYTVNDGKYSSGIYYDYRITDTLEAYTYQYEGATEIRYELEKEDGVWAAVPDIRKTTYNECGDIEIVDEYEYDAETGNYKYEEGERYYYSIDSTYLAIEEVNDNAEITLAPNPVKVGAPLTLTFTPGSVAVVDIYTIDGILVNSLKSTTSSVSLSSPNTAGTYIVRFTTTTGKSRSSKLIVR